MGIQHKKKIPGLADGLKVSLSCMILKETDLITKTWHKFNNASWPWTWGQGQVTYSRLICTLHDQCKDLIWWA